MNLAPLAAGWLGALLPLVLAGSAAGKTRVAVLPVQLDPSARAVPELVNDYLLTAAQKAGDYEVIGQADVEAMLGFEKQKDLFGCDDATCFADIGGALGVDWLVLFKIARVGDEWAVTGKLIDIRETRVRNRTSEFISGDAKALLAAQGELAAELLGGEVPPAVAVSSGAETSGFYVSGGTAANLKAVTGVAGYLELGYRFGLGLEVGLSGTYPFSLVPHVRWLWFEQIGGAGELGFTAAVSLTDDSFGGGLTGGAGWDVGVGRVGFRIDASVMYEIDHAGLVLPIVLRAYLVK